MRINLDPAGFTLRILRSQQAAGAPIIDGSSVVDVARNDDPDQDEFERLTVPQPEARLERNGIAILPLRLWTTKRAERPPVKDALHIAWRRGRDLNPNRWRPRYLRARFRHSPIRARIRRHIPFHQRALAHYTAKAVPLKIASLTLRLALGLLHLLLTMPIPRWFAERLGLWPLPPGPIPVRETETDGLQREKTTYRIHTTLARAFATGAGRGYGQRGVDLTNQWKDMAAQVTAAKRQAVATPSNSWEGWTCVDCDVLCDVPAPHDTAAAKDGEHCEGSGGYRRTRVSPDGKVSFVDRIDFEVRQQPLGGGIAVNLFANPHNAPISTGGWFDRALTHVFSPPDLGTMNRAGIDTDRRRA